MELSTKLPVATQTPKHTSVEVTASGHGGYTIANDGNQSITVEAGRPQTKKEDHTGRIAGIVIGIIVTLALIVIVSFTFDGTLISER